MINLAMSVYTNGQRLDVPRSLSAILVLVTVFAASAMLTGPASAKPIKIAVYGDSLVAGYGLSEAESYPAQLEVALKAKGIDVDILNAGVSGDTTGSGLARFDWAVAPDVDAVILELGANDALRGQPPSQARANLDAILSRLKERDIPTLIVGMRAPSNWGAEYAREFDAIYPELARTYDAVLYPFFLEGVATNLSLNQSDGIHPNAAGVKVLVERTLPFVEQLIEKVSARSRG